MRRSFAVVVCWLCSQVPVRLMAEVDFKLPYPEGRTYRVSQGNSADTNGDQRPDPDGTHGCFTENSQSCNPLERFALDFAMPEDSTVVAAADGVVKFIRSDSNTGGCSSEFKNDANYIVIDHADGTSTLYLHLKPNSVLVAVGDAIWQGQAIAKSGQTGWACGAHLHLQRQSQSSSSWYGNSAAISFSDVSANGGVPIAGSGYTSENRDTSIPTIPITPIDLTTTKIVFRSDRNGSPGLYIMDADGSHVGLLLPDLSDDVTASDPAWSPDGRKIAFRYGALGIYTVNADGTNLTFLFGGLNPTWSPDGKKITFESDWDVYVMDADGTHVTNLTPDPPNQTLRSVQDIDPTWSPDGQRIAYIESRIGRNFIWVMDVDGTNRRIVSTSSEGLDEIYNLAWSPEGGKFVLDTGLYVYVMSVDGKHVRNLGYGTKPAWSPDGRRIVFVWYRYDSSDIYVMDADGQNITRLIKSPKEIYSPDPSWSPVLSSAPPTLPTLTRLNIRLTQTAGGEVISNKLLSVKARAALTFAADGIASDNSSVTITPTWRVAGSIGSITSEGSFTAGTKAGNWGYVVVSAEGISDSIGVTILPGSLNRLRISPSFVTLSSRQKITFGAQGTDAYNNPIQGLRVFWHHVGNIGTINKLTGLFTAGLNPGTGYVIAFAGSANDSVITESTFGSTRARGSGSAKVVVAAELPTTYALSQNYPNPFNPETTINYSLPEMATTRLTVYNFSGQTVRTLVYDVHHSPGNYTVVWDGRDDNGQAVSSGAYFYRLEAVDRGFVETKRMLLLR